MAEFECGESEASNTFPAQASSLRKGGHIVIRNRPCKIVEMVRSQPGKHGHAKLNFIALDIFSGKKLEHVVSSTHNVEVPNVKKIEYILVNVSYEGYLNLMNDFGQLRNDLKLPDGDLGKEISKKFNNDEEVTVTLLSAMGEEAVISMKTAPTKRP